MTLQLDNGQLARDYRSGHSLLEVAARNGCSADTVRRRLDRMGIVRRRGRRGLFSSVEEAIVEHRYYEGVRVADIARLLSRHSYHSVYHLIQRRGFFREEELEGQW